MRTTGIVALVVLMVSAAGDARQAPADQWPNYQHNSNFSPLTEITPENVGSLTEAWTFNYGAGSASGQGVFLRLDYRFEVQPLLVGGVLYLSTPTSPLNADLKATVTAIRPETGEVLWRYESPRNIHGRGLAYWKGNDRVGPRLYFATDQGYLMAIDIRTGEPAAGFGTNGEIDIYADVVSPEVGESRRSTFTIPNPVAVFDDLLISGARPGEAPPPQPRGDLRAWDASTGRLVWSFHTVPLPGDPNHEDWPGDTWRDRSGCSVWSTMTPDESTGLVFASTADANRAVPGKNLYCNSILALDARTGALRWYHQIIHHDIWDFDLPTPPMLVDVQRDGRTIPAVFVTGKTGLVFIFDRATGEPLYGMEERPVAASADPAEAPYPTQPFPLRPGPLGRVGMTRDDINRMTPEIEAFCTDFWDRNGLVPSDLYWRPSSRGPQVTFPSNVGGPNWGPLSYNPALGYVFVNLHNTGAYTPAFVAESAAETGRGAGGGRGAGRGGGTGPGAGTGAANRAGPFAFRLPSGEEVPCYAPPYGELVAVDVNRGEIAWRSTLGINPFLAELGDVGVHSGARSMGGSIATASGLVFIAATNDRRFRAFDARTGAELWVTELPASGHSTPITYQGADGHQYVVIAAGGGTNVGSGLPLSDAVIAYRLP